MIISKVKIKRVTPDKGLVGFASCIVDDSLFLGNIAIFTRLDREDEIRLVFPIKEVGETKIPILYPLTSELYYLLEKEIENKYKMND